MKIDWITTYNFINLSNHLPSNYLLVFNNTKVFHARMHFFTERGTAIEVFCLEPANSQEPATALSTNNYTEWICMVGGAKNGNQGT